MAKMKKEEQARLEGVGYAIRFLEQGNTLEDLKEDARRRGATMTPIWVTKAMESDYCDRVKVNTMQTILLMACSVLQAEFDFGNAQRGGNPGRLARFVNKFNQYCGDMLNGDMDWGDLKQELARTTGIDLPLWFK